MREFAADESFNYSVQGLMETKMLDKKSHGSSNVSLHNAYPQLSVSGDEMLRRVFGLKNGYKQNGIMRSFILPTLHLAVLG
jgi:hypothetical protein